MFLIHLQELMLMIERETSELRYAKIYQLVRTHDYFLRNEQLESDGRSSRK